MLRRRMAFAAAVFGLSMLFCFMSIHASRSSADEPAENSIGAKGDSMKDGMIAHMVFFSLKESTPENRRELIDAAKKYLAGHSGEIYFSVGEMVDLKEKVSVTDFDVALHIVFENRDAHDKYLKSERHKGFSAVAHKLDKSVRVFDSVLVAVGR